MTTGADPARWTANRARSGAPRARESREREPRVDARPTPTASPRASIAAKARSAAHQGRDLINEVEGVVEDVGDLVGGIGRVQTVVGPAHRLQLPREHGEELRRAAPPAGRGQVLHDRAGQRSARPTSVRADRRGHDEPQRSGRTTARFARSRPTSSAGAFQFAKRLGPFTGRFGIKESTGGIGLDLHLLDDRFELRQDLFGFGEELSPRWRMALGYEFIRKLWLLGGVDDIINADRRDYFVGLQLRFTDQDLKSILPFAPSGF
jgi:phospholipid/cholesterol/gamma-HCH transport system substrate-binding protein